MGKRFLVVVALWLLCVSLGANQCLVRLNDALGPGEELKAFRLAAVSAHLYQVDFLEVSFIIDLRAGLRVLTDLREGAGAGLAGLARFLGIRS
ncbi:MAG TPA: hypothetical protein EYP63_01245 [Desulfotomaculum sp.]|nr:hypothetical protein [Desulfotomaculum sp.]